MTPRESDRPRTKIVATLGPATSSAEGIAQILEHGVDCARINASHGDHASHARLITTVREQAEQLGRTVAVLLDLQGPKIRLGHFSGAVEVRRGDRIELAVARPPDGTEFPVDYPQLDADVKIGDPLLLDDGHISTIVEGVEKGRVRCRVLNDGKIQPRKGINLPASEISAPSMTEKDRRDALFALEQGVDLVALSFVRRAEDLAELRDFISQSGKTIPIVAKIEKPQALDNLDGILAACWGVMVARGDLGVELSPEEVPMVQKRIIARAGREGRPVITATQMLESMTHNPRPTRAEASDVANAVLDGTDAVMLSGETSVGRYPVETVAMMARILRATEKFPPRSLLDRRPEPAIPGAVADAGCDVADTVDARAIVAFTKSGQTAILASRRRPPKALLAFSPTVETQRRLALVWGVEPFTLPHVPNTDALLRKLEEALIDAGRATAGDRLVLLMGAPISERQATNLMMVHTVGGERPPPEI